MTSWNLQYKIPDQEFDTKLNDQVNQADIDLLALREHIASLRSDTMQYLDTIKLEKFDETIPPAIDNKCCVFQSIVSTKFDIYLQQIDQFRISVIEGL